MGRDVFGLGDVQANPTKIYYFHPPFFSQEIRAKSMQCSLYLAGSDALYRKGFANFARTTASHTRKVTPIFYFHRQNQCSEMKNWIYPFFSTGGTWCKSCLLDGSLRLVAIKSVKR